jgi:uncharacterized protein (DUF934 family)
MRLVKDGRIVADRFVRVADDAPIPADVAAIVSHGRLLAEHATLLRREAATGVIWPNDRRVVELAPYLDRLALVGLVFPVFKDGRAFSQARLLREQYDFAGELRATGQVLRDQFLFMLRAGFDALEVTKEADAAAFAETVRRWPRSHAANAPKASRIAWPKQSFRAAESALMACPDPRFLPWDLL